ncbi:hypothetical protein [Paenibacillus sp. YN15]|uniref:hypothetical protein n=1 Tax=Paenibacillus sp. YN15 TaxID=1742774 RepID=UPI0015EBF0F9|nr:hypothetical protein [Paenibacillus sp. YN15]
MQSMTKLLMRKKQLKAILRMMDSEASFQTEEGRAYANLLVKVTLIQIQIDELQKETAP